MSMILAKSGGISHDRANAATEPGENEVLSQSAAASAAVTAFTMGAHTLARGVISATYSA